MRLLLLTGMSGAGKNTAFKILEDLGYNCVDNLPVPLLKNFVELAFQESDERVAVGIDIRSGEHLNDLQDILSELKNDGKKVDILYLDAEDSVLLKRYKETRRLHPLSGTERIQAGIEQERKKIEFLKKEADYIIDTTYLLTRELRTELTRILEKDSNYKNINVVLMSFGYKYGIPQDADLVFDVRFLPNPYYDLELRPLTGNDEPIQNFVMKYQEAHQFIDKLEDLVRFLIPLYVGEGKNQLVICIGCTGGKHRSITLTNELFKRLDGADGSFGLKKIHRDIDKDRKRGK
ncbi:MAG: RNase adapter RapZ [Lachnospiraceae bacterium]|nr:RNase adapter RapZ [Lachnospiraceae bacterium]